MHRWPRYASMHTSGSCSNRTRWLTLSAFARTCNNTVVLPQDASSLLSSQLHSPGHAPTRAKSRRSG